MQSITTFGEDVTSFVAEDFEAYAMFPHRLRSQRAPDAAGPRWRALAETAGIDLRDERAMDALRKSLQDDYYVYAGSLDRDEITVLLDHLTPATTTPDTCFFAVWDGFGDCQVRAHADPTLSLPGRDYHVFRGPIVGACTSHDATPWSMRSANLWWPADRAWLVASEIDLYHTYVGGSRACIDALLAEPRIEAVEIDSTQR